MRRMLHFDDVQEVTRPEGEATWMYTTDTVQRRHRGKSALNAQWRVIALNAQNAQWRVRAVNAVNAQWRVIAVMHSGRVRALNAQNAQ